MLALGWLLRGMGVANGPNGTLGVPAPNFWLKLVMAIIPLLIVGMTTIAVWVIEIRSNRYTSGDHTKHLETHRVMEREIVPRSEINARLTRIEDKVDTILQRQSNGVSRGN